jgi:copper transport protein
VELALLAGLLAITAALVEQPPAKAQVLPSGPFSTTAKLGPDELDLTVDPARLGRNEIHLFVLRPSGLPAEAAAEAHAFASLPSAGLGPLRLQAVPAGGGHFVLPRVDLAVAGDWKLRFEVRLGSFDQYAATVTIPIRKD